MRKYEAFGVLTIMLTLVLPIAFTLVELAAFNSGRSLFFILLKWLLCFGAGLRLVSSGVRQCMNPQQAAGESFRTQTSVAQPIVRQLGYANICLGTVALLVPIAPSFMTPAAVACGLYVGLTGLMHMERRKKNARERLAFNTDMLMFLGVFVLLIINL